MALNRTKPGILRVGQSVPETAAFVVTPSGLSGMQSASQDGVIAPAMDGLEE
jgi:hypothetical protein